MSDKKHITVTVVRSTEPIDLNAWLERYARAILEARGIVPATRTEAA